MSLFDVEYLHLAHDASGTAGSDRQARYADWVERRWHEAEAKAVRRSRRGDGRQRPTAARPATAAARIA